MLLKHLNPAMRLILLISLSCLFSYSNFSQCDNLTNGGIIGNDESFCTPYDPAPIINIATPTGGSGTIEYMWIATTTPSSFTAADAVPGANSITYDPPYITETTWYIRCARRSGCDAWVGESMVKKEIKALNLNLIATHIGCNADYGTVNAYAYGGVSPYSYYWDGILGGNTKTFDAPGIVVVEVIDATGCSTLESIEVLASDLDIDIVVEDPPCISPSDAAHVYVTGGIPPYDIDWSDGSSGTTLSDYSEGLSGPYTVTVTDASGCSSMATVKFDSGEFPKADLGCCSDTVICEGSTAFLPVELEGSGPWILTYSINGMLYEDSIVSEPYGITFIPDETSMVELVSVSNYCGLGEVCGKAFIGVESCEPEGCCGSSFYSTTEITSSIGGYITYQISIYPTGCREDLDRLNIGIPCGSIHDIHNSGDFPMYISESPDPYTRLTGITIEDIEDLGPYDGLFISFMVCPEECDIEYYCYPILAYKYDECIDFEMSPGSWEMYSAGNNPAELSASPNPFTEEVFISIKGGRFNHNFDNGALLISDPTGRPVRKINFGAMSYNGMTVRWDGEDENGVEVQRGLYYVSFMVDGYFEKASVRVFKN